MPGSGAVETAGSLPLMAMPESRIGERSDNGASIPSSCVLSPLSAMAGDTWVA